MTIKNYKRAQSALNKYYNKQARNARRRDFRLDSRGVRVPMTPAGLRAELRDIEKKRAAALAWLDACNAAPAFDVMMINVDWVKNPTWGNNPHAGVAVYGDNGPSERLNGSASGCGYDKRSAAIDSALRHSLIFSRLLIENWRKVRDCYGVHMWRGVPELDISGKGVGELRTVCERCGLAWNGNEAGRRSDYYEATRKTRKGGRA